MFPQKLDDIPLEQRIYCNRSLKMASIKAIGFDMDYTLALYKQETFEKLAYDETIKKLVQSYDYPKEILRWTYDHKYMMRGLVIDKKRGNILKIDRHRYVKVAYHGFRELTRDERRELYDIEKTPSYEEPDFALLDTIFALPEAYLITQLTDYKEKSDKLKNKTFLNFYNDIRMAIDLSHRDGSIKNKVSKNPEKYMTKDPYLRDVLDGLKLSGRKLFLLTNSLWEYTNVVMNYILPQKEASEKQNWTEYFDVIIAAASKPAFFMEKHSLYEVDTGTGHLKNIPYSLSEEKKENSSKRIYQGGHFKLLHEMLGISRGSDILYVGDHIYGDILRSKKELGWRTMLVIEELDHEIKTLKNLKSQFEMCKCLNEKKERLEDELERYTLALAARKAGREILNDQLKDCSTEELEAQIKKITYDVQKTKEMEKKELKQYHLSFHPVWGSLLKTSRQNSRFSAQVENYACLYISLFTNIRHYGVNKIFRASMDYMPHDWSI